SLVSGSSESHGREQELFYPVMKHPLCLSFLAGQASQGEDVSFGGESQRLFESLFHHIAGHSRFGFDIDPDAIDSVLLLHYDLVVVANARYSQEGLLNLF